MNAELVADAAQFLKRLFMSLAADERLAVLALVEDWYCFRCGALAHPEECP